MDEEKEETMEEEADDAKQEDIKKGFNGFFDKSAVYLNETSADGIFRDLN